MTALGYYVLDDAGEPLAIDDWLVWAQWMGTAAERRRVALDALGPGVSVSTVFLGIDHNWGPGAPVLFETMVFGGPADGWQRRYRTRAAAAAGHAAAVEMARAAGGGR